MRTKILIDKSTDSILNSLFQKDFSYVKEQILEFLECDSDKVKLFGIILCEHFKEIKKCEDINLKVTALKNVIMALSYLGEQ